MSTQTFSMQASRCPDATVKMRQLLRLFMDSGECQELMLESIEPSLVRSIPAYIAAEGLPLAIAELGRRDISQEDKEQWADHFDEDDYSDVSVVNQFTLKKVV